MTLKLHDSELKVMECLWKEGDLPAGTLAKILEEETGWNRNTTYTVIKKCVEKGAIERYEPRFMCRARIGRDQAQHFETQTLIDKMFDGSMEQFFAAFINNPKLSKDEVDKLRKILDEVEEV